MKYFNFIKISLFNIVFLIGSKAIVLKAEAIAGTYDIKDDNGFCQLKKEKLLETYETFFVGKGDDDKKIFLKSFKDYTHCVSAKHKPEERERLTELDSTPASFDETEETKKTGIDGDKRACHFELANNNEHIPDTTVINQVKVIPGMIVPGDKGVKTGTPMEIPLAQQQKPYSLTIDMPSTLGLESVDTSFRVNPKIHMENHEDDEDLAVAYINGLRVKLNEIMSALEEKGLSWPAKSTESQTAIVGVDSDLSTSLGISANIKQSGSAFSSLLKVEKTENKRIFFAMFKQIYFSVSRATPREDNLYRFLYDDFAEDYASFFREGRPPYIVKQVDYGRLVLVRAEYDESVMIADARAHFQQSVLDKKVGSKAKEKDKDKDKDDDDEGKKLSDEELKEACKDPDTAKIVDICFQFRTQQASKKVNVQYTILGGDSKNIGALSGDVDCSGEYCDIDIKGLKEIINEGASFKPGIGFSEVGYRTVFTDGSSAAVHLVGSKKVEKCESTARSLKFKNLGAYVAAFTVTWQEPVRNQAGKIIKYIDNEYECWRSLGLMCDVPIPRGSKDLYLKAEYFTGLISPSRGTIFDVERPETTREIFKVGGTVFSPWCNVINSSDKEGCGALDYNTLYPSN